MIKKTLLHKAVYWINLKKTCRSARKSWDRTVCLYASTAGSVEPDQARTCEGNKKRHKPHFCVHSTHFV